MALSDDLVSYWPLDEASGTRADSHGSNDLGDVGSVGSGTGLISDCAVFAGGNELSIACGAPGTALRPDDADPFTVVFWARLAVGAASQLVAAQKSNFSSDWAVHWHSAVGWFAAFSDGSNFILGGAADAGNWHMLAFRWFGDGTADLSRDAGTPVSGAAATMSPNTLANQRFVLGSEGSIDLDEVGFWVGRALSDADVLSLYNAGAGLSYSAITGGGGGATRKRVHCGVTVMKMRGGAAMKR